MRKKIVFLSIVLLFGTILLFSDFYNKEKSQGDLQKSLAQKVIRFHVVADNDTIEAQEFKLKVRDETITYLKTLINGEEDIETTRKIIYDNLKSIEEKAKEVACREKCDYEIRAQLCIDYFPVKEYGSVIFPAGYYQALKIDIGEAKGKNWWCVMYPNLCFVEGTYAIIDEETEKEIKNILTEEEYDLLLKAGNVKVKYKSLEMIKSVLEKIRDYL